MPNAGPARASLLAGQGERVTAEEYMRRIVEPTIDEMAANRASMRHAIIACLATFHALDYLAGSRRRAVVRGEFRRLSPAFAAIDRIAHGAGRNSPGDRRAPPRGVAPGEEWMQAHKHINAAADFLRNRIRELDSAQGQPANDTYYVVIPFARNADGDIRPGAAQEAISAAAAERRAAALAAEHGGAVAFSRRGDPVTGEFDEPIVLAQFGEVDMSALGG